MKNYRILLFLFSALLISCSNTTKNEQIINDDTDELSVFNALPQSVEIESKFTDINGIIFNSTSRVVYSEKSGNEKNDGQIELVKSMSHKIIHQVFREFTWEEAIEPKRAEIGKIIEERLSNELIKSSLQLNYVEVSDITIPDSLYQTYIEKQKKL